MIDPRFFKNAGPFALGEIADRLGGRLSDGAPRDMAITDLAMLDTATNSEIAMFGDRRYRAGFNGTKAGVVMTVEALAPKRPEGGAHLLYVPSPRQLWAEVAWLFYPTVDEAMGEAGEAEIGPDCRIADSARIGPGASIGARTQIGANAVIGAGVVIGEDCKIEPNTRISHTIIGNRVHIYAGAVVGSQGFGFVPGKGGLRRVPQLGRVLIGDNVEFGSNSTIDRGTLGDTVLGPGTVVDNLVQIGHNVRTGRSVIICGQTGIAGSVTIEDGAVVGGACGIADHVVIGAGAKLAGGTGVINDIAPGQVVAGYPAIPARDWHRQTIELRRMFEHGKKDEE